MKTPLHSAVIRAMIGLLLGMLAGGLIGQSIGLPLIFTALSDGVYGAIVMGSTVLYGIEPWSLTRSTACHLLITLAGFCVLGLIQNWLSQVPPWMLLVFLAAYFAIWLIQWMMGYYHVRKMNAVLRRQRLKNHPDRIMGREE